MKLSTRENYFLLICIQNNLEPGWLLNSCLRGKYKILDTHRKELEAVERKIRKEILSASNNVNDLGSVIVEEMININKEDCRKER